MGKGMQLFFLKIHIKALQMYINEQNNLYIK